MRKTTPNKKVHTVPSITQAEIMENDRVEVERMIDQFHRLAQETLWKNRQENAAALEKANQVLNKQKSLA